MVCIRLDEPDALNFGEVQNPDEMFGLMVIMIILTLAMNALNNNINNQTCYFPNEQ